MHNAHPWNRCLFGTLALAAATLATPAAADTLLNTGTPDPGWIGYWGYDINAGQSVAIAFTPTADYTLDQISLWLMSNDFNAPGATFTLSLQTDASGPSGSVLESWDTATSAVGWVPALDTVTSVLHPVLSAGSTYWIVAESTEEFEDPVWVIAPGDGVNTYVMANNDFLSGSGWQVNWQSWTPGGTIVSATPVPEPAMLVLALLGLPLTLAAAKRRAH